MGTTVAAASPTKFRRSGVAGAAIESPGSRLGRREEAQRLVSRSQTRPPFPSPSCPQRRRQPEQGAGEGRSRGGAAAAAARAAAGVDEAEVRGGPLPPSHTKGRGQSWGPATAFPEELRERLRPAHNLGRGPRRQVACPAPGGERRASRSGEAAAGERQGLAGGRDAATDGGRLDDASALRPDRR